MQQAFRHPSVNFPRRAPSRWENEMESDLRRAGVASRSAVHLCFPPSGGAVLDPHRQELRGGNLRIRFRKARALLDLSGPVRAIRLNVRHHERPARIPTNRAPGPSHFPSPA